MPTPEALSLVHLIRHAVDMSDEDCASEIDRFTAQRGAPEPRCRMEQFGDGSCDCPQCRRMRGLPPQTGGGDAGERELFDRKTAINIRVQARYDELMREGKHGHYETMFRIIHEERRSSHREGAETISDDMNAAHWHGYREGAEAMRRDAALFIYGADVYGRLADRLADGIRALPIPGKTDAG